MATSTVPDSVLEADETSRDPSTILVVAAFTVIAVALAFPSPWRFHSYIVGDSGDALLNMWIMRSVEHALPHGWHTLWNQPIYYPAANTLAYSDTLFPVALVLWPMRVVLGDAGAFNLIYLGSWVLSSWCTYRLARRFVAYWGAAFVAALAYTYASVRLVQHVHFQLAVGGALVPLAVLLLVRLFERPTTARALALAFALVCLVLTASYYGPMTLIVVAVVAIGPVAVLRLPSRRLVVRALGIAALAVAITVAPFALKYLELERNRSFRRSFQPFRAAHVTDLLAAAPNGYLLRHLPLVSWLARPGPNVEHRLFPGLVTVVFAMLGIALTVRSVRRRRRELRGLQLAFIGVAGMLFLVLSFGDWVVIAGHRIAMPFALFRRHVPGYAGMRAVSRLMLPAQLALATFAAVGLDAWLARLRNRWRLFGTVALTLVVMAESATAIAFVRPPTSQDDGGVDEALQRLPRGVVLELPIASSRQPGWIYNEPSRQLLALHDSDPRVNGYSGFEPAGFPLRVALLNTFPSRRALNTARQLGVRYVVLRTALVGDVEPAAIRRLLERDGVGRYDDRTARQLVSEMPPGSTTRVESLRGAYLIELA